MLFFHFVRFSQNLRICEGITNLNKFYHKQLVKQQTVKKLQTL